MGQQHILDPDVMRGKQGGLHSTATAVQNGQLLVSVATTPSVVAAICCQRQRRDQTVVVENDNGVVVGHIVLFAHVADQISVGLLIAGEVDRHGAVDYLVYEADCVGDDECEHYTQVDGVLPVELVGHVNEVVLEYAQAE